MADFSDLFVYFFFGVVALVAVFAVLGVFRALYRLRWERKNRAQGITVTGTVTGVRTVPGHHSGDHYHGPRSYRQVVFRTQDGQEFLIEDEVGGRRAATKTTVPVRYHPNNPKQATVADRTPYARAVGAVVVGLIILAFVAAFAVFAAALMSGGSVFDMLGGDSGLR